MKNNKTNDLKRQLGSFFIDLGSALIIVLIINSFLVQNLRVQGQSMTPMLRDGDIVLLNKVIYDLKKPQRGDIIGFHSDGLEHKVIKRVVGLPGDKIDFHDDMIYINNEAVYQIEEGAVTTKGDIKYPYDVPEKSYFVMGDNYNHSIDSRFNFIGSVQEEQIIGRVDFRTWPFWENPFLK